MPFGESFRQTPTIEEMIPLRARAPSHFFSDRTIPLPTNSSVIVLRNAAACALLAMTLCAGCTGPLGGHKSCATCGTTVGACGECECAECESCDTCESPSCAPCAGGHFESCQVCLATAQYYTCSGCLGVWHCVEPCVCWPVKKCWHVLNFCAPDGYIGPPEPPCTGRFFPVPTQPVFAPRLEQPMAFPADQSGEFSVP